MSSLVVERIKTPDLFEALDLFLASPALLDGSKNLPSVEHCEANSKDKEGLFDVGFVAPQKRATMWKRKVIWLCKSDPKDPFASIKLWSWRGNQKVLQSLAQACLEAPGTSTSYLPQLGHADLGLARL